MTQRVEPDPTNPAPGSTATDQWTYGKASNQSTYPNSIDKLVQATCTGAVCTSAYTRTYAYDSLGRQRVMQLTIGAFTFNTVMAYDGNTGKTAAVKSFSGFTLDYGYNSLGYLSAVTDDSSGVVYWQPNSEDAELHVTQETAGNGVVTQRNYDPNLGYVDSIAAGSSAHPTSIANFSYSWDSLGDLTSRTDMLAVSGGQSENFCYDALNRLKYSAIATGSGSDCNSSGDIEVDYDATGNITSKTGVGGYSYGGAGPHAVSSVNTLGIALDGVHNPSFTYDANGNTLCVLAAGQTCTAASTARYVTYTSFDMTATIAQGTASSALYYDSEHNRIYQSAVVAGATTNTVYFNDPVANVVNEKVRTGGVTTWKNYIKVGGQLIALRTAVDGSGTFDTKYFITDHLGSVAVVTDGNSVCPCRECPNYGKVTTRVAKHPS